ncbi:hypothetical protein [Chitinivibrio alkaliphilus]|uniref:Uncharacterized protein n=1 Tax=Chitinivibrio alkaliphilus ACht1 TaxID=1313304 RepID=U7DA57_9BACT|nr:hypothetical protein [Chitinivibrio alkaliphilus]ERP39269.1 hypothetical protein CALK_0060 [Chitinivibrio alkaliphilus ACht1]
MDTITSDTQKQPERIFPFHKDEQDEVPRTAYELAENLLEQEEKNAKNALGHLWRLKSSMGDHGGGDETISMLIEHYQNKIDLLRDQRITLLSVTEDSKNLMDEQEQSQRELRRIRGGIQKCTEGIQTLQTKKEELEHKEAELELITSQIEKELILNNKRVVNGLYEVVHPTDDMGESALEDTDSFFRETVPEKPLDVFPVIHHNASLPVVAVKAPSGQILSHYYIQKTAVPRKYLMVSTFHVVSLSLRSKCIIGNLRNFCFFLFRIRYTEYGKTTLLSLSTASMRFLIQKVLNCSKNPYVPMSSLR